MFEDIFEAQKDFEIEEDFLKDEEQCCDGEGENCCCGDEAAATDEEQPCTGTCGGCTRS